MVGFLFFVALVVGAITSAVSMLEVVVSSAIDGFDMPRKKAAIGLGVVIALIGLAPASSLNILGLMDAIVGEFLLVVGALGMAILVGWAMRNPSEELLDGASGGFRKVVPLVLFMLRFVVPPLLIWVIWNQGNAALSTIQAALGG